MKQFIAGIGALAGLLLLLVGIPAGLIALAGNPIPGWDVLIQGLTQPDWTGSFMTGHVLPLIGWAAWLSLAFGILSVMPATVRGIEPPQIKGLALQQATGRALIGALLIMFTGLSGVIGATAAEANTVSAPAASGQQLSQPESAPATPTSGGQASVQAAPAEVTPAPTVTVKNGDSLWAIAEGRLGDGNRYSEIAQLNYGVPQADGGSLSSDHFINTGWTLTLPSDATVSNDRDVRVNQGETLKSIAAAEYGDSAKAPQIFEASQSIVQPDGNQIGRTHRVLPGYRLVVPDASPQPTIEEPAAESTPTPEASAPAPAAAEETKATAPADSGTSLQQNQGEISDAGISTAQEDPGDPPAASIEEDFPGSTLWGAGGVLAAGVLSVLGARRFRQNRYRKAGERISMPDQDIAVTELELRAAEDPAGIDDIDNALHYLANWAYDNDSALPKLFAVRLSPGTVELYLDEAAQLPEPFEPVSDDNCAWSIDPRILPAFDAKTAAPYPALVTLGQDTAEGHILIDLEQIGTLNLLGDPEMTEGALTALTIELACSKWADELRISVVGFAAELPTAFDTGRVRHIQDIRELISTLEARTSQDSRLLKELGLPTSHDARISSKSGDSWPPEIILLSEMPDDETSARLAALVQNVPRVGIAAVTQGHLAGEWTLDIAPDRTATLTPAGIILKAQIVAGENYTNILGALRSTLGHAAPAALRDVPAPAVRAVTAMPIEGPDTEVVVVEETGETAANPESRSDAMPVFKAPDRSGQLVELETRRGRTTPPREEIRIELPNAPFVRVMGNVRIENAKGVHPGSVKGASVARATEVITFLALHRGQSTEEYDQAIHPNKVMDAGKRNPLITRARKWLDTDPEGQDFLSKYDVAKCYTLLDVVRTDWDVFQELVGNDIAHASQARLEAALELVTGQPFSGVRAGRGAWAWSESDQQLMVAAIADVSYELAERAREDGNAELMLKASLRGSLVNPASEMHKRHKLQAYAMAEDLNGFERTVQQIHDQCEALEEDGPQQETLDLIDELRKRFERIKAS